MDNIFDCLLNDAYSPLVIVHSYADLQNNSKDPEKSDHSPNHGDEFSHNSPALTEISSKNLIKSFEYNITSPGGIKIAFLDYNTYSKFENNYWDSQLLQSIRSNLPSRSDIYNKLYNHASSRIWFDEWALKICRGLRPNSGPPSGRIIVAPMACALDFVEEMLGKMGGKWPILIMVDDRNTQNISYSPPSSKNPVSNSNLSLSAIKDSLARYKLEAKLTVELFDSESYIRIVRDWLNDTLEILESEYNEGVAASNWDESFAAASSPSNRKAFWWESKFFKSLELKLKDAAIKSPQESERSAVNKKILGKVASLGFSLGKFRDVYGMLQYLSTHNTFDSEDVGGRWFEYLAISNLCMDEIPGALCHLYSSFNKYRSCGYFRRCLWVGIVSIYICRTRQCKNLDNWTVSSISLDLEGSNFFSQDSTKDMQMSTHARAGLLLEQSAIVDCYSYRSGSCGISGYTRKGSLQLVLAGHRFTSAEFRLLALFCYMQVAKNFVYWPLAFEHLLITMARQAVLSGLTEDAVWHYALLIAFIFYDKNLKSYQTKKQLVAFKQLIQAIEDKKSAAGGEGESVFSIGSSLSELFDTIQAPVITNDLPLQVPKLQSRDLFIQLFSDLSLEPSEDLRGNGGLLEYPGGELLFGIINNASEYDIFADKAFVTDEIAYQCALIQQQIAIKVKAGDGPCFEVYKYFSRDTQRKPKMFARNVNPGATFGVKLHLYNHLDIAITCQSLTLVTDNELVKSESHFICMGPNEDKFVTLLATVDPGADEGLVTVLGIKYTIFGSINVYFPLDLPRDQRDHGPNNDGQGRENDIDALDQNRGPRKVQVNICKTSYPQILVNGSEEPLGAVELFQGQLYDYRVSSDSKFDLALYPASLVIKTQELKLVNKCLNASASSLLLQLNTSEIGFFRLYLKFNNKIHQQLIRIKPHIEIIEAYVFDHYYVAIKVHNHADAIVHIQGIEGGIQSKETKIVYLHRKHLRDDPFKPCKRASINNKYICWNVNGAKGLLKMPQLVSYDTAIYASQGPLAGSALPIVVRANCSDKLVSWDFKTPYRFSVVLELFNYGDEEVQVICAARGVGYESRHSGNWPFVRHFTGKTVHCSSVGACESLSIEFMAAVFSPGTFDISNFDVQLPGLGAELKLPESLIIIERSGLPICNDLPICKSMA